MLTIILLIFALPTISTLFFIAVSFLAPWSVCPQGSRSWWRLQIFVAYDQLINAYFQGWSDETISSRAYRHSREGVTLLQRFIDAIFFWSPNHCQRSYEDEKRRNQLPPELRGE